jgi:hypothetical protein
MTKGTASNDNHQENKKQQMLVIIWVKGTLKPCWLKCKLVQYYGNQYGDSSKNLKQTYFMTLPYHYWAYIRGV